jgi:hypothetical protein
LTTGHNNIDSPERRVEPTLGRLGGVRAYAPDGPLALAAPVEGDHRVVVRGRQVPRLHPVGARRGCLEAQLRRAQLVDRLASRWGSELDGASLTTWFVLEV